MFEFLKKQKEGLIVGLIGSAIFAYFVQPIADIISSLAIKTLNFFGLAILDKIYRQVALLDTSYLLLQIYGFIFFIITLITLSIVIRTHSAIKGNSETNTPLNEKSKNKILLTQKITGFVSIIVLCVSLTSNFIQFSTISSFNQHIRIISPFISEQEQKEIISEWSRMQNKTDYIKIYNKINNIANSNKITLPQNSIYTLLSL